MTSEQLNRRLEAITEVSQKGKKVKDLHRLMYKPDLYLEAYRKIYSNYGAVTRGVDDNTLDGMSLERIDRIIESLKKGVFKPKAVRRAYISKANGKKRPLGIPVGDDKLVQEVIRMLLERIYEPIFLKNSHGFRPYRSCHTALLDIQRTWTGTKWLIDFDIKGCFDNINHKILLEVLGKRIEDIKFLRLIKAMLRAGYMEDWKYNRTYSGTPQGGVCSPILANIYLHELDNFVVKKIEEFNKGKRRAGNPRYKKIESRIYSLRKKVEKIKNSGMNTGEERELRMEINKLDKERKKLSHCDPIDRNYKRLRYVRYADDFIAGVIGSKAEALQIMNDIKTFVKEKLNLEISSDKTGINSAKSGTRFLGYDVKKCTTYNRIRKLKRGNTCYRRRTLVDVIQLHIPKTKITQFCKMNGYGSLDRNESFPRPHLVNKEDFEIFLAYNAELRGFANYYSLAYACKSRLGRMFYIAEGSLIKTLGAKYRMSRSKIYARYRKGYDLVCTYSTKDAQKELMLFKTKHIDERKKYKTDWVDSIPGIPQYANTGSELINRLMRNRCEYCGTDSKSLVYKVHQVRKLSDISKCVFKWQEVMLSRRRKTLVLCTPCFKLLKSDNLPEERCKEYARGESAMR